MNILPKKRWHVRTRDNIARVRRDEAKAAEEEKEKQRRALLAEQETRTAVLRKRARERQGIEDSIPESKKKNVAIETHYELVFRNGACISVPVTEEKNTVQFSSSGHVNFFTNLEEGQHIEGTKNKEHENENKAEQEEYEKKIGLLTYLGQGSKEASGESPWYEKPSLLKLLQQEDTELKVEKLKTEKLKDMFDPLRVVRHHLGITEKFTPSNVKTQNDLKFPTRTLSSTSVPKTKKNKKKKKKKSKRKHHETSSDSSDSEDEKKVKLAQLRVKRLQREKEERLKSDRLLISIHGDSSPEKLKNSSIEPEGQLKSTVRKYHSQYNPDLARQNQPLDSNTKYWLQ